MYWPVAKEISLKDISILSSADHVVIIFCRGHHDMRNISVKLF